MSQVAIRPPNHIRHEYERFGVEHYYALFGSIYRNPHEQRLGSLVPLLLHKWQLGAELKVLDLACGSGEITLILRQMGFSNVHAIDPYTAHAFQQRTGTPVLGTWTFEQIAAGCLLDEQLTFDLVICSFAAHLISHSYLPLVMMQLRHVALQLVILTPHKRPELQASWGWTLCEELLHERIRARLYK